MEGRVLNSKNFARRTLALLHCSDSPTDLYAESTATSTTASTATTAAEHSHHRRRFSCPVEEADWTIMITAPDDTHSLRSAEVSLDSFSFVIPPTKEGIGAVSESNILARSVSATYSVNSVTAMSSLMTLDPDYRYYDDPVEAVNQDYKKAAKKKYSYDKQFRNSISDDYERVLRTTSVAGGATGTKKTVSQTKRDALTADAYVKKTQKTPPVKKKKTVVKVTEKFNEDDDLELEVERGINKVKMHAPKQAVQEAKTEPTHASPLQATPSRERGKQRNRYIDDYDGDYEDTPLPYTAPRLARIKNAPEESDTRPRRRYTYAKDGSKKPVGGSKTVYERDRQQRIQSITVAPLDEDVDLETSKKDSAELFFIKSHDNEIRDDTLDHHVRNDPNVSLTIDEYLKNICPPRRKSSSKKWEKIKSNFLNVHDSKRRSLSPQRGRKDSYQMSTASSRRHSSDTRRQYSAVPSKKFISKNKNSKKIPPPRPPKPVILGNSKRGENIIREKNEYSNNEHTKVEELTEIPDTKIEEYSDHDNVDDTAIKEPIVDNSASLHAVSVLASLETPIEAVVVERHKSLYPSVSDLEVTVCEDVKVAHGSIRRTSNESKKNVDCSRDVDDIENQYERDESALSAEESESYSDSLHFVASIPRIQTNIPHVVLRYQSSFPRLLTEEIACVESKASVIPDDANYLSTIPSEVMNNPEVRLPTPREESAPRRYYCYSLEPDHPYDTMRCDVTKPVVDYNHYTYDHSISRPSLPLPIVIVNSAKDSVTTDVGVRADSDHNLYTYDHSYSRPSLPLPIVIVNSAKDSITTDIGIRADSVHNLYTYDHSISRPSLPIPIVIVNSAKDSITTDVGIRADSVHNLYTYDHSYSRPSLPLPIVIVTSANDSTDVNIGSNSIEMISSLEQGASTEEGNSLLISKRTISEGDVILHSRAGVNQTLSINTPLVHYQTEHDDEPLFSRYTGSTPRLNAPTDPSTTSRLQPYQLDQYQSQSPPSYHINETAFDQLIDPAVSRQFAQQQRPQTPPDNQTIFYPRVVESLPKLAQYDAELHDDPGPQFLRSRLSVVDRSSVDAATMANENIDATDHDRGITNTLKIKAAADKLGSRMSIFEPEVTTKEATLLESSPIRVRRYPSRAPAPVKGAPVNKPSKLCDRHRRSNKLEVPRPNNHHHHRNDDTQSAQTKTNDTSIDPYSHYHAAVKSSPKYNDTIRIENRYERRSNNRDCASSNSDENYTSYKKRRESRTANHNPRHKRHRSPRGSGRASRSRTRNNNSNASTQTLLMNKDKKAAADDDNNTINININNVTDQLKKTFARFGQAFIATSTTGTTSVSNNNATTPDFRELDRLPNFSEDFGTPVDIHKTYYDRYPSPVYNPDRHPMIQVREESSIESSRYRATDQFQFSDSDLFKPKGSDFDVDFNNSSNTFSQKNYSDSDLYTNKIDTDFELKDIIYSSDCSVFNTKKNSTGIKLIPYDIPTGTDDTEPERDLNHRYDSNLDVELSSSSKSTYEPGHPNYDIDRDDYWTDVNLSIGADDVGAIDLTSGGEYDGGMDSRVHDYYRANIPVVDIMQYAATTQHLPPRQPPTNQTTATADVFVTAATSSDNEISSPDLLFL